jgi:hypothetical protein
MQQLFELAFARLDRAKEKRAEFGREWGTYIDNHPWDIDLTVLSDTEFEFFAIQREPAPAALSMVFSEWLATIRAALDNGFYAWVVAATGQNPPLQAERLQYPICTSSTEFKKQRNRLTSVPPDIVAKLEMVQPYRSPYGPESNLFYWINELARTDRHRTPHIGIGRIATHKVRIGFRKVSRPPSIHRCSPITPLTTGSCSAASQRAHRYIAPNSRATSAASASTRRFGPGRASTSMGSASR